MMTTNDPQALIEQLQELPQDRLTARRIGAKTYRPASPCRRGHLAPVETYGRRCTQCVAEVTRKADAEKRQARSDAAKVRRMEAKLEAEKERLRAEREAVKKAARDAAAEARKQAKAAATREANKAAREAAAREPDQVEEMAVDGQAVYAVRDEGSEWGEEVPW